MPESGLDRKRIIAELTKSAHGKLDEYLAVGRQAALEDPDFFAHLVAWNHVKGQVRDARIALPVIALSALAADQRSAEWDWSYSPLRPVWLDNALAHLADLRPRELARVLLTTTRTEKSPVIVTPAKAGRAITVNAVKSVKVPPFATLAHAPKRVLRRFVTRYLRDLEADRREFERTAVQHRATLHSLYAHFHVSRPQWVGEILFAGEKGHDKHRPGAGTIFEAIRHLKDMSPEEAAGVIAQYKIPFLIARGALGAKAKEPDQVLALMKAMSPTDLVSNMKWLDTAGVKTVPALRSALEDALGRAATAKTARATMKTSRAAEALVDDERLSGKLHALQEKQLDNLAGIDGDWLVLGDKSGSMSATIETARQVAAVLTRMVRGKVHLVFFDTQPMYLDATGKTLEELTAITRQIMAVGGTSIGCGLQYMLDKKIAVDGIAIVSDGGENNAPYFGTVYPKYCVAMGNEPTVYLYQVQGESDVLFTMYCKRAEIDVQRFDLRHQAVDYYSLPNIVGTMRVGRYQLIEEILNTPLRTLDEVLDRTQGTSVLPKTLVMA